MTPFDILRKLESDFSYIPPEGSELRLWKISVAKSRLMSIINCGPMTDAATEAMEVLIKVRNYEFYVRQRES